MLRAVGVWRLAVAALAGAAADLAGLGLMATAAWLIARAAQQPPLAALTLAIVGVRAFALSRGAFRYAERLAGHDAALRALAGLRDRLFRALIPARSAGPDVLSRVVSDADAVQDLVVRCAVPAAAAGLVATVALILAGILLPPAAVVLATGLLLAGVVVPVAAFVRARRTAGRIAELRGELAVRTADLLHGAADLTAYGAVADALDAADAATDRLARMERSATGPLTAVGILVQGLTAVAVTAVAVSLVDGVVIPVLALTALAAFEPVLPLAGAAVRYAEIRGALVRVDTVLAAPPAVREPVEPVAVPPGPLTVVCGDLGVRYAPDGPPALDGIALRLEPGRRVAVVGPSGSGKSTLLAVLLRLVEYDGLVELSGVDLRSCAGAEVRRAITGVTQDAYLFHTSLRANLQLARPGAGDAELAGAARAAGILDWIDELPDGWETVPGDRGGRVSGGQRARLVLARALLAGPRLLVLDEPTEGLDPDTADAILAKLFAATEGRTLLLVTHRLSGLEAADEVVVLDEGRVIQRGRHAELTGQPGWYQDAWRAERLALQVALQPQRDLAVPVDRNEVDAVERTAVT